MDHQRPSGDPGPPTGPSRDHLGDPPPSATLSPVEDLEIDNQAEGKPSDSRATPPSMEEHRRRRAQEEVRTRALLGSCWELLGNYSGITRNCQGLGNRSLALSWLGPWGRGEVDAQGVPVGGRSSHEAPPDRT